MKITELRALLLHRRDTCHAFTLTLLDQEIPRAAQQLDKDPAGGRVSTHDITAPLRGLGGSIRHLGILRFHLKSKRLRKMALYAMLNAVIEDEYHVCKQGSMQFQLLEVASTTMCVHFGRKSLGIERRCCMGYWELHWLPWRLPRKDPPPPPLQP